MPELSKGRQFDPADNAAEWKMLASDIYDTPPLPPPTITSKSTFYIHRNDLFRVYEGIRFANYIGIILNACFNVCWERAGYVGDEAIDKAYRMFADRFRKFSHYNGFEPYFWTTFENGPVTGIHSHMGLHIKEGCEARFRQWLSRALMNAKGEPMDKDDYYVDIRRCNEHSISRQWFSFQYGFKGLDPRLSPAEQSNYPTGTTLNYLAGVREEYTGALSLKRVRISRTMREAAHKKANYQVIHSMADIDIEKRYDYSEYRRGISDRTQAEISNSLRNLEDL